MLAESAAALAAAAGSGLVSAMVGDAWQEVSARAARLLGLGDAAEETRQQGRLERARAEIEAAPEEQAQGVRERQEAAWRTRITDLLEEHPEVGEQLSELVAYLEQRTGGAVAGTVQVNAQAHDHAQQAVLGQGVQNVSFNQQPPAAP